MRNTFLLLAAILFIQINAQAQCSATVTGTTDGKICGSGNVQLQATGTGTGFAWYAGPNGGVPIGAGPTYTSPVISDTTIYYVAAVSGQSVNHTGAPSPNAGTNWGSTNLNAYQIFDVSKPLVLQSVSVYPTIASGITVGLQNSSGSTMQSKTFTIASAQANSYVPLGGGSNTVIGTPLVLPLNFTIQPGTGYKLVQIDNNSKIVRNLAGIPAIYYDVDNFGIKFTGNWLGSSPGDKSYWYNFYDWVIANNDSGCESARVPVIAAVNNVPVIELGNDTTFCGPINLTLNADDTSGYKYAWSTADTTSSIQVASVGVYKVIVEDRLSKCKAEDSIAVFADVLPTVGGITFVVTGSGTTYNFSAVQAQNGINYYWDFGDGTTSNSVFPKHTYAVPGNYTVKLCITNACNKACNDSIASGNTTTKQVTVVISGIDADGADNISMRIYPVPAQNYIVVESVADNEITLANIFDATGTLIKSAACNNAHLVNLQIGELPVGIYCLGLQTSKGFIVRKFEILR